MNTISKQAPCVEKMKSIAVLFNLLNYFYYGIQCDKTCNFVQGVAFEVLHKMYRF